MNIHQKDMAQRPDSQQAREALDRLRLWAETASDAEIVALDDNNEITGTIASFKSNGETDGHEFAFDSALRGSIGIAVRTAAGGLRLVMVSA
ncbi:MAG: hypothetical protein COB69_03365 [Phycisphaera sp.]|nr:MAG: hypothetical protein COB69_03365 [Phycisphaera sp.]